MSITVKPQENKTLDTLNCYRRKKLSNRRLAWKIDELKAIAASMVPSSRTEELELDDMRLRIAAMEDELRRREEALVPLGSRVCAAILSVPSEAAQQALELRYLHLMKHKDVAKELGYSVNTVHSLLSSTIKHMDIPDELVGG